MTNDAWTCRTRGFLGMVGFLVGSVLLSVGMADAQDRTIADGDWCDGHDRHDGESVCEVREWTMGAPGDLSVNARPNGGISVEAWDRGEMQVRAKVHAWADSDGRARELVDRIEVKAGGSISADGPGTDDDEGWSVSYRIMIPRDTDLDLASTNGGITIEGVRGELRFQTTNGGIHLEDIGGDVEGKTTNGGVHIVLTGDRWDGKGMEVRTTNGGVKMSIPSGYSAHLETGTVNGGINIGFPVTVQGKIDREVSVDLGSGGATIKATTKNGGVRITEGR
ncbi:MAG: DUF4097 family beta strand repeat-containing protein [Gemmatimonadota bacterium]